MIRDLKAGHDPKSGFPVVSWEEDRPLLSGAGSVRVACFIEPEPKSGALLFAAIHSDGRRLAGRSWAALKTFSVTSDQVLQPPSTRALIEVILGRSKSAMSSLFRSGGHVVVAQFEDAQPFVPMYLNAADASQAEVAELHDVLNREFRTLRDADQGYIDRLCVERFQWRRAVDGKLLPFTLPQLQRASRSGMSWWELVFAFVVVAALVYAAAHGFWRY